MRTGILRALRVIPGITENVLKINTVKIKHFLLGGKVAALPVGESDFETGKGGYYIALRGHVGR